MGLYQSTYIGPYIETPNAVKEIPRDFNGCSTRKCSNFKREMPSAFCPKCGGKIEKFIVQSKIRPSGEFDMDDEFANRLSYVHYEWLPEDKLDVAVYTPNVRGYGVTFGEHDSVVFEFNETVMIDSLTRFKADFAKEIARLEEFYGSASVKWGVISYRS